MTYGMAAAIQRAVFEVLEAADIGPVFDAAPSGELPDLYLTLGSEDVRDRSTATSAGAEHRFVVSIHGTEAGFASIKARAALASDAILNGLPGLSRGHVVSVNFVKARARRLSGRARRRIDLTFRVIAEDG